MNINWLVRVHWLRLRQIGTFWYSFGGPKHSAYSPPINHITRNESSHSATCLQHWMPHTPNYSQTSKPKVGGKWMGKRIWSDARETIFERANANCRIIQFMLNSIIRCKVREVEPRRPCSLCFALHHKRMIRCRLQQSTFSCVSLIYYYHYSAHTFDAVSQFVIRYIFTRPPMLQFVRFYFVRRTKAGHARWSPRLCKGTCAPLRLWTERTHLIKQIYIIYCMRNHFE